MNIIYPPITDEDLDLVERKAGELDADGNFARQHDNPNNLILKLCAEIRRVRAKVAAAEELGKEWAEPCDDVDCDEITCLTFASCGRRLLEALK